MLTKCPDCSTTFRVTPAQLKVRAGKVRCGKCKLVFNALETLDDDIVEATPIQAIHEDAALPIAPVAEVLTTDEAADEGDVDVIDIGDAEVIAEEPAHESLPEAADDVPATEIETAADSVEEAITQSQAGEETADQPADLTDYLADSPLLDGAPPSRRWPWILASVVAAIALAAQAIYFYRVEIAVLRPDLRPLLQRACKPLRCEVPRPRTIESLSIDASDLHPDVAQTGRLTLSATLRNKAVYAQEWPTLELTLTDVADHKLAVKHFAAVDYVPKGTNLAAGFPANGETVVTLPLDVGDLPAVGYRLYIFYP